MQQTIENIRSKALEAIKNALTTDNIDEIRVEFLSRKSELNNIKKNLKDLSNEEKRIIGPLANKVTTEIETQLNEKYQELYQKELNEKLEKEQIDVTLPGSYLPYGKTHLLTQTINEISEIFEGMGFSLVKNENSPEVETEYFNFDIENSFVSIIDGAVLDCDFNISNSTIGIGSTGWADFGIGISSTKGNVVFKGIPYGGEQFDQYCLLDRPYAVFSLYSKMGNSTLSFEDLSVTFRNPTIHPSTTFNFRNCDIIIHSTFVGEEEKLTVQGGNVNIDNCLFSYNPSNTSHIVVESGKLQIDNSDS